MALFFLSRTNTGRTKILITVSFKTADDTTLCNYARGTGSCLNAP